MTFKWGCKPWGTPWGNPVFDEQSVALPNQPPRALITWDVRDDGDYIFAVYVDGAFYATTRDRQMVVAPGHAGRFYFDVFALAPGSELLAGALAGCLDATLRGDRIKLVWTRPGSTWGTMTWGASVWGEDDASSFEIYWDEGLGTSPLVLLATIAAGDAIDIETGDYVYTTSALVDGTYEFRVDPIDEAGNKLTPSALTTTHGHDPPPLPPADLLVTGYASGPMEFTATWTASSSSDVVSYRVYDNGGGGDVDYSTIVATIAAPASGGTWVRAGVADGDWIIALRAVDATSEETNVDVRDEFELASLTVLGKKPATPVNIIAAPIAGAAFRLGADYPADVEEAIGTLIEWYNNGGGVGPIDFSTVVATVSVDSHTLQAPIIFSTTVDTAGLTDGLPYKWAARSKTASGRLSDASVESALIYADGTAPEDNLTLTSASVL